MKEASIVERELRELFVSTQGTRENGHIDKHRSSKKESSSEELY